MVWGVTFTLSCLVACVSLPCPEWLWSSLTIYLDREASVWVSDVNVLTTDSLYVCFFSFNLKMYIYKNYPVLFQLYDFCTSEYYLHIFVFTLGNKYVLETKISLSPQKSMCDSRMLIYMYLVVIIRTDHHFSLSLLSSNCSSRSSLIFHSRSAESY